jgi:hypothetical protein
MGSHQKNEGDFFLHYSRHQLTSKFVPYFQMPKEKLETLFPKTVKGKAVPVLYEFKQYAMKAYGGVDV